MPSVLFVFTSANKNSQGGPTGWYLPEAAHPYYALVPHVDIDFASPKGPNPPVDEYSVKAFAEDKDSVQFLNDEIVKSKLANAKKLSEVNADNYDAVFYPGGHGPAIDLPFDATNHKLASEFFQAGKITAAVCHGPAALVGATGKDGKSVFNNKKATGFSNKEEELLGTVKAVPFLLEDKIKENGGLFEMNNEPWGENVVVDGNLITGQNPNSGLGVGKAILAALQK
ncbi:hypothetical protein AAF712_002037 [Marasmius tenuissimus]|uniref:D-lactate dehydratase n=1 Tax=Marasmius tenuissimus TaxID=585030 RepID=A0ABR3ABT8_9AGAR